MKSFSFVIAIIIAALIGGSLAYYLTRNDNSVGLYETLFGEDESLENKKQSVSLGVRHIGEEGNFSYRPPEDWRIKKHLAFTNHYVFGPVEENTCANIGFISENYDGDLGVCFDLIIKGSKIILGGVKVLKDEEFETDSGIIGRKYTIRSRMLLIKLRQVIYLLPSEEGLLYVMTCTASRNADSSIDDCFEACAKSFEFVQEDRLGEQE